MLQCERSGVYKPPKTKNKLKLEGTYSRKCDCPFRMRGNFEKKTNERWLTILNRVHNHELEPKLDGHLLACRLRKKQMKKVVYMTKRLALPRNILTDFNENNKESVMNIKQVYSACAIWRKSIEVKRRRCNTWLQSWSRINKFISQYHEWRKWRRRRQVTYLTTSWELVICGWISYNWFICKCRNAIPKCIKRKSQNS